MITLKEINDYELLYKAERIYLLPIEQDTIIELRDYKAGLQECLN